MKKYLFATLGFALAIGFSAFTKSNFSLRTFVYTGSTYTKAAVETESNWVLSAVSCTHVADQKACSFTIDVPMGQESSYYNVVTGRLLSESGSSGVTIHAAAYSANCAFVVDVTKAGVSIAVSIENVWC